ncbi:MAG: DNA polymerase I [Candidatus Thiodiazotropha sp. (ex Ctena orbiculata)]|uniref:DNA polymerase I n=1 Tax=Candidatus Thiodiazotropha taylori TaxID=2792791 RepID=A0A944QV29_9GAMM|nr:DNA polymerase I [Candidatus Thiodiazotropha taylori]MBT2989555.1 DNA polymerase I [Candidatus Thiodiazotropha taylori]MBT2997135.1 DNA polymerase I [Candidatus Thiodiazotropha taylori]MBT3001288.1 DNA polymerase I [Candidatus Thiodiazotropha taylori]MBV2107133.1 DNA polymerase I [Candidatus Thiodiazotropha taylori]
MSKSPPFILIDGSSYLFRAYHVLQVTQDLKNSKGEPTGAILGVVNMLRRLLNDYHPEYIAVVFDAPGGSFRNQIYKDYKANRPPMPEDLRVQIEPLHNIIHAMGLPLLMVEGVEADDVIGTLARQATEEGIETLISTGDKDMAQLVNAHVTLINTMSETTTDAAGVVEKFGVRPDQIIDYLALVGDAVDNIPGVPKCGPKTAAKWLGSYDTLDNLIAHAAEIKGKIGENLRAALPQLPLSRELATIKLDVTLDQGPTDLKTRERDSERLRHYYQWMESNRLLASLGDEAPDGEQKPVTQPQANYEMLLSERALEGWIERLEKSDLFAFDTETTSLDYMQAELVGLSFAIEPGEAAYVPVGHDYPGAPEQLSLESVLTHMKPLLENPGLKKVGQNLKYDMSVLARYGIAMRGIAYDTMLESYVLDATATRHDMDSLAKRYLEHETIHFETIAGKGKKQLTFDQIELELAAPYAAEDADITLRLHQYFWPKLESEDSLKKLLTEMEVALIPVLSRMERNGVTIDSAMLRSQSDELAKSMHQLEQQAYALAGHSFNLGSPKQIGEIFFTELKLPVIAKTPKGAPSTAESVLVELAEQGHELPAVILEHRGLSKLKSTYTDKLPEMANPETGRVHTSYHQAVAATGRLSSTDPNLQNIPVRTEAGRRIRQAFIPQQGWKMLAADYSQIELRIMAHLSGDEGLLRAFSAGEDIHRATAAEVFEEPLDRVTAEQRRSAKAINFGLIYGMSAFGLARQLGIERGAAQEYVDLYFKRYPGVQAFMDRTRQLAHDQGYVETLFGRRLYLPDINAKNHQRRAAAERTAINAPMQGSAADIIKRAMLAVDRWIERSAPPARLLMQVHDELVFEVDQSYVTDAIEIITSHMEQAADLSVPLLVDVGVGDNWDQAH